MNQDLIRYIAGLPSEKAIRIWLRAVYSVKRNGTSNLAIKDLCVEYRCTREELFQLFDIGEAKRIGLIRIMNVTQDTISINIKPSKDQESLTIAADLETGHAIIVSGPNFNEPEPKILTPVIQIPEKEVTSQQKPQTLEVTSQQQTNTLSPQEKIDPENYTMSIECQRAMIGVYCEFYKHIQRTRAALIGKEINPVNPRIGPKDVKQLKNIAAHFITIGFDTEPLIISAFKRMYNKWFDLSDRLQNMFTPGAQLSVINELIVELQNTKNLTKSKRDEQTTSKISEAKRKDYSHLAGKRG